MLSKQNKGSHGSLNLTDDNKALLNYEEMADHTNAYFTNVGSNLANLITMNNDDYINNLQYKAENVETTLDTFPQITVAEIKNLVNKDFERRVQELNPSINLPI